MQRGKQYIRAIRLYYRKFGAYPASVDALVNTNQIRCLRKRYLDPTTGKDDWKPIRLGQNKTPLAMGFFGQPLGLGGVGIAGATPAANGIGSSIGASSGTDNATANAGQAGGASSGSDSSSGQTFGGGPIIGFSPASPKQSILVYKKKNHYNEWEFLYSPLSDQMVNSSNQINQPPLQGGSPGAPQSVSSPAADTSSTSTSTVTTAAPTQ